MSQMTISAEPMLLFYLHSERRYESHFAKSSFRDYTKEALFSSAGIMTPRNQYRCAKSVYVHRSESESEHANQFARDMQILENLSLDRS